MGLLDGKVAFIFGIANHRSIAWGIAKQLHEQGATIALSIFNEDMRRRVEPLAEEIGCEFVEPCDVNQDDQVDAVFEKFAEKYGSLDILVHSIAFAPREALGGRFTDIKRDDFKLTLESSAYSLIALAKRAEPIMKEGSSIMTMTYYAAEKYIPDYNAMAIAKSALESITRYLAVDMGPQGIRVNAISAGPIKTLAAAGIPGFRSLIKHFDAVSPLGETVSVDDVGKTAVYLGSDLSRMVTGEIIYVDSGYQVLGITVPRDEM